MSDAIYREKQKPDSIWAILVLAVTFVINWMVYFLYGEDDFSFLYKTVLIALLTALFFSVIKLETEISKDKIKFRLFPIHFKWVVIEKKDIQKLSVVSFQPLRDYGGWGLRWVKNGKAYIVKGNNGLRLDLSDGRHILIGTQNKEILKGLFPDNPS